MVAVKERKSAYEKALLIASGPAMLERLVRPLKEAGLAVNACENFQDAARLFDGQALVVLPIKEDSQADAKAFVDELRGRDVPSPYILGVGRCDEGQRLGLVAKIGLNDLIAYPFDEDEVKKRLASFKMWSQMPVPVPIQKPDESVVMAPVASDEMLHTTRVSLFADADDGEDSEAPEAIYCREAPVGIAMFDRELKYVLANPRWIQQFRLKDREIIGKSQFEIFPKLHTAWRKIYERCLDGETRRGREEIATGTGPVEMLWEVRPWRYRNGQIGGVTIAFEEAWKPSAGVRAAAVEVAPQRAIEKVPASSPALSALLGGPAMMVDLSGGVLELNEAAEELKVTAPEVAFLESLRKDPSKLPMTEVVDLPGEGRRLAWSNTLLRDAAGVPERVLRVGVVLPDDLIPAVEVVAEVAAVAESKPKPKPMEAPAVEAFDDDSLDELTALVWKANLRGEITYFNAAWLEFRDRPLARELNGGWLDGLHASDARATKAVVAEAIRNQTSLQHTFRLKSAGGDFVSMDMWVQPYHSDKGELSGFYGLCREHQPRLAVSAPVFAGALRAPAGVPDVEAVAIQEVREEAAEALAKLAEAEREVLDLKDSVARLSALHEEKEREAAKVVLLPESPFMLWQTDLDGRLTAVNSRWNVAFGKAPQAAPDEAWLTVIPDEEERQEVEERLRIAATQGVPLTCRFTWKPAQGEARRAELQAVPVLDGEGRGQGLSGSLRDVTEELQALNTFQSVVAPADVAVDAGPVSVLLSRLSSKLPQWQERQASDQQDLAIFREVFDNVAAGIVLLGADGKAIVANRRHRDLLDYGIEDAGGIEGWLRRGCSDADHMASVLKIWQEDVWQRQLTKVLALKASNGTLREIRFEPQLFLGDNRLLLTLQDVTEGKRSEEAMRDSEIRFRALFRESPMGIALIDAEGKIYDVNPGMERLLEVSRRQILCREFDACLHPDDLVRKQQALKQLLDSPKRSTEVELRLEKRREREGILEDVWVRLHIALVRDVDQRVLFTAYFVQDVTEQKRLQAELQISQEQNRALLEVIPDLILLVDRRGQVIDLMPGESMPDGLVEENAIGQRIDAVLPSFGGHYDQLIQRAYVVDDVVEHPFLTEQKRAFTARIVACKPDNAVITIQETRSFAEEPARVESVIPPSVLRSALTFLSSPQAVVITNFTGEILDWNPSAASFFGYSLEEAMGQPLPALFGVDTVEALTERLVPDANHRWVGEMPFQRKDRSVGMAELVFVPLKSESGSWEGQVAFLEEAKPAPPVAVPQEEVAPVAVTPPAPDVAAMSEEIREECLSKLVPQMHQRLRNNLQIIGTLLNLQYKSQQGEAARLALLTSRNRAHTLLLLHELIQAKEDEERVDFRQFAQSLVDHLLESYDASDRVNVVLEVDGQLDLQSASPLSLILNELVTNAIVHGFPDPESGAITISLTLDQGAGTLTVRDDGLGLEGGSETSGMGLQIVKTLANQIGGSLEKLNTTETEFRVCFMTSLRK